MRFKDGKIIEHTDQFKLSSWCRQALGWPGVLFGRMNWFQRKVRRSAQQNLYDYIVANRQLKIILLHKTVYMTSRRKFLQASLLSSITMLLNKKNFASTIELNEPLLKADPIVISTWDAGLEANKAAWKILSGGGRALDAVEEGVKVTEASRSCCVGLGANPDRDGFVTLDASIMDEFFNCGSVAFLERIKHPISVARRVMEKTPHVMLVGSGAQQFAIAEGFPLEEQKLSPDAQEAYDKWLKKSEYKPVINIENLPDRSKGLHDPFGFGTGRFKSPWTFCSGTT